MRWDPEQYSRFAGERGRPFTDLLARVGCAGPRRVIDLGCGPGTLTAQLATRWPGAEVEGIDSSAEMIARAAPLGTARLSFRVEDVAAWPMPADADVVVSNAALQWVPRHQELLRAWAAALPVGAWLAFQVPGNFDAPSHTVLRTLASTPRWRPLVGDDVLRHHDMVATPSSYARLLLSAGLAVDAWSTTYLHLLPGPDAVLEWMRGTGLRPVLAALADRHVERDGVTVPAADAFAAEYGLALREAYPATGHGTLFAFRRIFAVARKP
ncbi:MAG: trans-aconitate 2-methyltransferase [Jatrophihabitantaceae bacterium]